ncbi:MAG: hypothetical protein ACSLFK_16655 [Gemmatimonadaceae bacterium]
MPLLIMLASAGCDGKPEQPFEPLPAPPGPDRFTIEITASTGTRPATVQRGDTVVLTAVLRNQAGAIVTTGTVLWNLNIMSGQPSGTPNEMLGYVFSLEPIDSRSVRVIGHSVASALVSGAVMGVGASFPVAVVSIQYPFIWSQETGMKRIPTPGDAPGEALAINNRGEVAGWYMPGDTRRAFLWSYANGFRDIGPEGDLGHSAARAINEHGVVAGDAAYGSETNLGFVYRNGVSRVFSWNDEITGVYGINDDGAVVGEVTAGGPGNDPSFAASTVTRDTRGTFGSVAVRSRRAFRWTDISGVRVLPVATGKETSRAFDINNNGEIVGYDGEREAGLTNIQIMAPAPVVWNKKSDAPTELLERKGPGCENGWEPLLSYDNACAAVAVGINDAGQVAGVIGERAFRRDTGLSVVMFPDAAVPSTATGINSRGDISGHFLEPAHMMPEKARAGFVWLADGRVVKLGTLPGAVSTYANAINDRGQVVGYVY